MPVGTPLDETPDGTASTGHLLYMFHIAVIVTFVSVYLLPLTDTVSFCHPVAGISVYVVVGVMIAS
jgi:hypothetical protein